MPGMTAYVGLLEVGALKDGETVFVSALLGLLALSAKLPSSKAAGYWQCRF